MRGKQIEEMERDLIDSVEHETLFDVDFYETGKNLIAKGYRKVVMCCECKYCEIVIDSIIDEPKWFCTRMIGAVPIDPTDYCSRAKMKGTE